MNHQGKILVTGANGFVGKHLCRYLKSKGYQLQKIVRKLEQAEDEKFMSVGNIDGETNWLEALEGVETVVHLAARVHVMQDTEVDPLTEYRKVNVAGTENLARQAADNGVRRFVYLSSIKVLGESTNLKPFTIETKAAPTDPYGQSKLEAEILLKEIAEETGLEIVIVRPPLVYGPGVRANFFRLLRWVDMGVPLPLKSVSNKRSMVSVMNLVDFLLACIEHHTAAGNTFLLSDGEDISTPELISRLARQMNRRSRLFSVPTSLLYFLGGLVGKAAEVKRLCGSLQVDISYSESILQWSPIESVDDGLSKTVKWFLGEG